MATGNFVAYYRVSTKQQGNSGLGLDAQKEAVAKFLNGGNWNLVTSFEEVESGKRNNRPQLAEALQTCKLYGATLVVAKLDRLARNLHFVTSLMESGVEFVACDMPVANKLTIHLLSAVAEAEGKAISERTKAALAAKNGNTGGACWKTEGAGALSEENRQRGQALGLETIKAKKEERWALVLPTIQELQSAGLSYRKIAAELNRRNIPTANKKRGGVDGERSQWSATVVSRMLSA